MNKTIAQEALELLEPIPVDKWVTEKFYEPETGRMCALAHYASKKNPDIKITEDVQFWVDNNNNNNNRLRKSVTELNDHSEKFEISIAVVNNGYVNNYRENTPKERVMHLLHNMIKAGY